MNKAMTVEDDGTDITDLPIRCSVCEGSGYLPNLTGNEVHHDASCVTCPQCGGSGEEQFT